LKILIDECLHPSLVEVAALRGHEAYHVAHHGLAATKDWNLMPVIVEGDFVFVTNNARDFRRLYAAQPLHAGLVIVVPQLPPPLQRQVFDVVLDEIGGEDGIVNEAIEVTIDDGEVRIARYGWPADDRS
jgi:predicted nuclease of predicted toxin-antitoxin system